MWKQLKTQEENVYIVYSVYAQSRPLNERTRATWIDFKKHNVEYKEQVSGRNCHLHQDSQYANHTKVYSVLFMDVHAKQKGEASTGFTIIKVSIVIAPRGKGRKGNWIRKGA